MIIAVLLLMADGADGSTGYRAKLEVPASAEELTSAFIDVCLKTPDVLTARAVASSLPNAVRVERGNLPANFRVYQRPNMSVGLWGLPNATCYVTSHADTPEAADKVVALLSEYRGKPLKVRNRRSGFQYVFWKEGAMDVTFEFGRNKDDQGLALMITATNKGR